MAKYVTPELCDVKHSALKEEVIEIKQVCKDIKENHLAHMQNDIAEMKIKITIYSGIAAFLATIIAQFIFR